MIRSNLAVLLAERGLKISKVSADTGITRVTLTALVNNSNQGIQFDTLDKLCVYLKVTPKEFFSFVPFSLQMEIKNSYIANEFDGEVYEGFDIQIDLPSLAGNFSVEVHGKTYEDETEFADRKLIGLDLVVRYEDDDFFYHEFVVHDFQQIPISFKPDIEKKIANLIISSINTSNAEISDNLKVNVSWSCKLF